MPVTLQTADVAPRTWKNGTASSTSDLLKGTNATEFNRSKRIIQSSFSGNDLASEKVTPSKNGLVYTILGAWSGHHHLTLRPEDIWFAILSQLNFYINAHAEELRSFFVAHEGQKELKTIDWGTMHTTDYGAHAEKMTRLIEKSVVDPELRTWIMPAFSTTTQSDRVVASILMMGALQKYFKYTMMTECGIPSVTLLGEKADWEMMVEKLDKLQQLGAEPTLFAALLRPVLERFVLSFETPEDPEVLDFWSRIVHRSGGSGSHFLSGWATAFCLWDEDGKSLHSRQGPRKPVSWKSHAYSNAGCELDGQLYHRVETTDIPSGFAFVPVTVDDNGTIYNTKMIAGSVGIQASSSGQMLSERNNRGTDEAMAAPGLDTLQPVTGWWMYEIESEEDKAKRQQEIKNLKREIQSMGTVAEMGGYHSAKYERYGELGMEVDRLESF